MADGDRQVLHIGAPAGRQPVAAFAQLAVRAIKGEGDRRGEIAPKALVGIGRLLVQLLTAPDGNVRRFELMQLQYAVRLQRLRDELRGKLLQRGKLPLHRDAHADGVCALAAHEADDGVGRPCGRCHGDTVNLARLLRRLGQTGGRQVLRRKPRP